MRLVAVAAWLAAAAPHARAQPPQPARSTTAAHRAQRDFERQRRDRLPTYLGGGTGGPCEVQIGRLCYWNNNADPPAPREPHTIAVARDTLLARLARAARDDSTSDWIAGQRVRYLAEAKRFDEAVAVADACRGTPWWCAALRGLARHERGDIAAGDVADAAAAFDSALALLPATQRCRWSDVAWWLDGALAKEYRRLPCGAERDAWERRFWIAARPLLMLPGDDLRAELLARRTMSRIRSQGAIEYQMAWGDDFAELEARYGWPAAWSARTNTGLIGGEARSVIGHEPTPSFAFVPRASAVATPVASREDDWELGARYATMRYAPRYAPRGIGPLAHQIARFRRGDSTLVVAAWDASRDRAWSVDTIPRDSTRRHRWCDTTCAALVLVDSAGVSRVLRRDSAAWMGAIVATVPAGAYLASLELLAGARGRAARARHGITAVPRDTLMSDLLLLREPQLGLPAERIADLALGTTTIKAGTRIGIYWETYFAADSAAPVEVTVQATRLDTPWYEQVGHLLRLGGGPQTPVAVRFADATRPNDATTGRSIGLTWPPNATGTYRLEVTVRAGDRAATAATEVSVVRP